MHSVAVESAWRIDGDGARLAGGDLVTRCGLLGSSYNEEESSEVCNRVSRSFAHRTRRST